MLQYPEVMQPYLQWALWGNTASQFLDALVVFVVLSVLFGFFRAYGILVLKRIAARTPTDLDDLFVEGLRKLKWPFYTYLAFYFASLTLTLPAPITRLLTVLLTVSIMWYALKGALVAIDFITQRQVKKREEADEAAGMINVLGTVAKGAVWLMGFLLLLANLGIEITPLIAGLGIGGIAIAFALQNVLEDLFSAFAIYFDKPFKRGDFIIVGTDMGVVEHVGLKTTRLKTLQGQQLIISNRELTSSRINNYKRMAERRVQFGFGVEYSTTSEQLRSVKNTVAEIFDDVTRARLDRVHFKEFADSSLDFEVVYYVDSNDYNVYMDVQEDINLKLHERLKDLGVSMAFPTRTVHLAN
jgi:small-conductance mechanosensitive channel